MKVAKAENFTKIATRVYANSAYENFACLRSQLFLYTHTRVCGQVCVLVNVSVRVGLKNSPIEEYCSKSKANVQNNQKKHSK